MVVYHLGIGALPGGFLGVDVFFVISGFLITTLLMTERSRHGRIRLGRFYARRARRLLPALIVMLAGTALLVATVARDAIEGFRGNVAAALLYVSNWWYIAQDQSYFELIGRGNVLAHLWSLAVEEQFYLIWPAVAAMIWGIARARRASVRRTLAVVAGVLALASTAAMAVMSVRHGYPLDADPSRAYFGTDTHAMSVLTGAALAALWRPGRASARIPVGARVALGAVGLGLAALLGWVLVSANEYSAWMYRGGFLVVAILVAALVAVASHPASPLGTVLEHRALRWVGERSYGIYLWHWPILLVTRPGQDLPWHGWWVQALRLGLVLVVAAASYRLVEEPIRRGAVGRAWARLRVEGLAVHRRPLLAGLGVAAALAAVVGVSFSVGVPRATDAALGSVTAITAAPVAAGPGTAVLASSSPTAASPPEPAAASSPTAPAIRTQDVAVYGDSVALWSADVLARELPGSTVDAAINRAPASIMSAVLDARRAGTLRPVVIMHMGTAGPVKESTLRDTLDQLRDQERVVLVGSTARFAYVGPNNALLAGAAADHPNVVYGDWPGGVAGHDAWLEDGLHLTEEGKPEYAAFLRELALDGEQAGDRERLRRVGLVTRRTGGPVDTGRRAPAHGVRGGRNRSPGGAGDAVAVHPSGRGHGARVAGRLGRSSEPLGREPWPTFRRSSARRSRSRVPARHAWWTTTAA